MEPDGVLLHRQDINEDALFLPHTVVAVLLQHTGTTIAYLGKEEEVSGVCLVVLQGEPVRQFVRQHL